MPLMFLTQMWITSSQCFHKNSINAVNVYNRTDKNKDGLILKCNCLLHTSVLWFDSLSQGISVPLVQRTYEKSGFIPGFHKTCPGFPGHASLNFLCFLGSDWLISFRVYADNQWSDWNQNQIWWANSLRAFPSLIDLVMLQWIPTVSWSLIGLAVSMRLQTNHWLDWAQIWWANSLQGLFQPD